MSLVPWKGSRQVAIVKAPDAGSVSQAGSTVSGNQVAGSYHQTTVYQASKSAGVVEQLVLKLQHEVEHKIHASDVIARLQRYHGGVSPDGVKGLAAKLDRAGRSSEIPAAVERKEMFAKLLEKWSLYASAQEIFVHLLARAEHYFTSEILPEMSVLSELEINQRMNVLIVEPTVEECGATVFQVDHLTAMGMVYWLAEQCFVRWH